MVNRGASWPRETAIALWFAGRSGSQIAEALDVTRGAVMGYLNRQGIVGDPKKAAQHKAKNPKKPQKKDKPPAKPEAKPKAKPKAAPIIRPAPPVDILIKKCYEPTLGRRAEETGGKSGCSLLELEKGQCRFPISDHGVDKDAHVFCGAACGFGQMYCKKHLEKMRPQK